MSAPDQVNDSPPPMPRWVKVFISIIVVVLLMFVLLKVLGGRGHGPARHMGASDTLKTHANRR